MSESGSRKISSGWKEESGKPPDGETGHGAYSGVEKGVQVSRVLHVEQDDDTRKNTTERSSRPGFSGEYSKNEQSTEATCKQSDDLKPLIEDAFSWIDRKQQGRAGSDDSQHDRRATCKKEFL